ncbi:MAG: hypothetical protein NT094_03990, partial [Candidatus Staskawiczbacteria bacterium]|nr:hypothetical protein [Candidatus Staskawiczbacteria bacterium]
MTNKIDINFLKKVPVVAYALIILFLMGIIVLVVMRLFFSNEALLFYLSYYCNTYFLTTIFALIFFYIFIKMFLLIYDSFVIKKTTIKEKNAYLKDLFYFLIIIYIGAVSSGIILNQLPHNVTPEKIIWTS